jgi:hypothetical protein
MDPRVALLRNFSRSFVPDTVKIETERFGFDYLDELLAGGATLDYGELTAHGLLHKYKLTQVPAARMDALLQSHLAKECNVCRYFDATANDVFCFNLDNNHKTNNTVVIPAMTLALRGLRETLLALHCPPLIVASGRGYHVWGRLTAPVDNLRLYDFMLRAAARALLAFRGTDLDHRQVKFNFYPDIKVHNVVSLRLFGSDHAKNKVFSRIFTPEALLDESNSWIHFEDFVRHRAIPVATFANAFATLSAGVGF